MRMQGLLIKAALLGILTAASGLTLTSCSGDPNDPHTWGKKLKDLREREEALDRIAAMDAEKAKVVVPQLMELYNETRSAEHLQALARYKDPQTKPLFIEALSYTDEEFDRAVIAAGVLGEMKATEAVDKLIAASEQSIPIKSRANAAKLAAMRALVKIGDPKAVPTLVKILETSADEQDFLLNQRAALGLAELRDPQAIPALIKGLFMTGRGTDIFQECRLGLVRLGDAAVDPVIALLEGKNADVQAMAAKYKFDQHTPGIVPFKAAYLLGDLRAEKAVPLLIGRLGRPARGQEHSAMIIALGQIATSDAVDALMALLDNGKADAGLRASAADALYMTGDKRALPLLLKIAESGYVKAPDGSQSSALRANAAIDFARLAGPEHFASFKPLVDKEKVFAGEFGEALDRMQVAKECGDKLDCLGKALADPAAPRAEKAAFAIGFSGNKDGIPRLLGALKPLAALGQERYSVHQAVLFALVRLADKTCKPCEEKLREQIERDEKAVRLPGARGLLAETRVALAVIQNTDPGEAAARAKASAASGNVMASAGEGAAPKGKAAKGKGGKAAKGKGRRR